MAPFVEPHPQSHYSVLGADRSATHADIQKAYKKLALKHHPDKNPEDRDKAEETFKRISKAYAVLNDPLQRSAYDGSLDGFGTGKGPSDFGRPRTGGLSDEQADCLFQAVFGAAGAPTRSTFSFDSPFDPPSEKGTFDAKYNKSSKLNMDDLLAGCFSGLGGVQSPASQRKARESWVPPQPQPQQPEPEPPSGAQACAIAPGTAVVIRGLEKAPQHNGKTGRIVRYDTYKRRYDVDIDNTMLSLKPQSLTQQCQVTIAGHQAMPELNGQVGDIINYDSAVDNYMLLMRSPPVAVSMERAYCVLPTGTRVAVSGLSQERYNAQLAQIVEVHPEVARYSILCQNGEVIKVKYDKVIC